jgi:Cu/Ag efflux pump CusA
VARYVEVAADVRGRDIAAVTADVERRLNEIEFPLEYRAELLQSAAERLAARNRAVSSVIAAAVGIFLLLQAVLGSWSLATVLLVTLPAAAAGGLLAAFAFDGTLTLGAILGLVAVFGIAVRNGLGSIKLYQRLATEPLGTNADANGSIVRSPLEPRARLESSAVGDQAIFAPGAVQRGAWERFTPIIMTATITALAVLPLVLLGDVPGNEILRPMAAVILGGLVTTTLFTLFGIPALFLLFTPSRGPELEDLEVSLVGEQELRESIPETHAAKESART